MSTHLINHRHFVAMNLNVTFNLLILSGLNYRLYIPELFKLYGVAVFVNNPWPLKWGGAQKCKL